MNDLLGVWKVKYITVPSENGVERQDVTDDPEMARIRYVFKENGVVEEAMYVGEQKPKAKDLKMLEARGWKYENGLIITETKAWKEENGILFSEISAVPKNATEMMDMGPIAIVDGYLSVFALFTTYLLEKEA